MKIKELAEQYFFTMKSQNLDLVEAISEMHNLILEAAQNGKSAIVRVFEKSKYNWNKVSFVSTCLSKEGFTISEFEFNDHFELRISGWGDI